MILITGKFAVIVAMKLARNHIHIIATMSVLHVDILIIQVAQEEDLRMMWYVPTVDF
jgi:hypothetical protein